MSGKPSVVALTADLMDRSKLEHAIPEISFEADVDADVVILDLVSGLQVVTQQRAFAKHARIVCYGPHVDEAGMAAALEAGADVVLPRSRFFRDPAAAIR